MNHKLKIGSSNSKNSKLQINYFILLTLIEKPHFSTCFRWLKVSFMTIFYDDMYCLLKSLLAKPLVALIKIQQITLVYSLIFKLRDNTCFWLVSNWLKFVHKRNVDSRQPFLSSKMPTHYEFLENTKIAWVNMKESYKGKKEMSPYIIDRYIELRKDHILEAKWSTKLDT